MGYLRRPIRRGSARAQKLSHLEAARLIDLTDWRACVRPLRARRETYLRFVVRDPAGGWIGLFRADRLWDEADEMPDGTQQRIRSCLRWFNRTMCVPRRLPQDAVCWFRGDAKDCVDHLRELIELYRQIDQPVMMRATESPGRIVYRDAHQIAAVPFKEGRARTSAC